MIDYEYRHAATANQEIGLRISHQWQGIIRQKNLRGNYPLDGSTWISQKKSKPIRRCLSMWFISKVYTALLRKSDLNLLKPQNLPSHGEVHGTEEHVKLHHRRVNGKIQNMRNSSVQNELVSSIKNKLLGDGRGRGEEGRGDLWTRKALRHVLTKISLWRLLRSQFKWTNSMKAPF